MGHGAALLQRVQRFGLAPQVPTGPTAGSSRSGFFYLRRWLGKDPTPIPLPSKPRLASRNHLWGIHCTMSSKEPFVHSLGSAPARPLSRFRDPSSETASNTSPRRPALWRGHGPSQGRNSMAGQSSHLWTGSLVPPLQGGVRSKGRMGAGMGASAAQQCPLCSSFH